MSRGYRFWRKGGVGTKVGVLKLRSPSPASCGGYPDGPGLTGRRHYGEHPHGRWRGSRAGRRAAAVVAPGKVSDPGAGELCREPRGAAVTMAPGGEGVIRAPPRAPRGRRLQMVPGLPREPAACGRGEAIVLLPRRRSPAARARAPPRAPPPPAPRAPRAARAP